MNPKEKIELERLKEENPRLSKAWVKASNDYETMKEKRDAANNKLAQVTSERDSLILQKRNLESNKERQDAIAKWIVQLDEFQKSLSNENPRTASDFKGSRMNSMRLRG